MKAMWIGFAAAILIAVAAGLALDRFADSSAERYSVADTRI